MCLYFFFVDGASMSQRLVNASLSILSSSSKVTAASALVPNRSLLGGTTKSAEVEGDVAGETMGVEADGFG